MKPANDHLVAEASITAKSAPEKARLAREALGYSLDDLAETCGLRIGEITAMNEEGIGR